MQLDDHGNHLLDETELKVMMELQEWQQGTEVATWLFYDRYRFKLVRQDENQVRQGRDRQTRYQRKFRLYEHRPDMVDRGYDGYLGGDRGWYPSLGGQWHDSMVTAYERAKYVSDCYHESLLTRERDARAREQRQLAEHHRPRYITQMNPKRSTW